MTGWRLPKLVVVATAVVAGAGTVAWATPVTVTSKGIAAASLPVTITTASFTAVADSYTQQASPSTNSGTANTMQVASASSADKRSFVRFDLSTIPATARVQSATLQLTMSSAPATTRTYEVDQVDASWGETTITWSNMPSAAAAATATVASGTSNNVNLTWSVTPDVAEFVASSAVNFGWQVKDTVESGTPARTATFRTSDFGNAGARPTLTVVYAT
jgi:hypothetical protein